MQGIMPRKKIRAKKKVKKKKFMQKDNPIVTFIYIKLLWRDVINLLCYCHHKNFAVLLWFAIIAFKRTVCRSIILDIFNMIWPHN